MRTIVHGLLLLLWSAFCHSQMPATGSHRTEAVAMTVGNQTITVSELCTAIQSLPPPQRTGYALHPNLAAQWFGHLIAVAQEATREHVGVSTSPQDSEVDRDNALVGAWIQATARNIQPTENEIEIYYRAHRKEFEQVRARHILISYFSAFASHSNRSEPAAKSKAEAIALQLRTGTRFQALAALNSEDPYTREKGGDLGYVSHHQLEPALDHALWSLAPGQRSAPFKGRFGYEIVLVENKRIPLLEAVREIIIGKMKAAALERKQQEIIAAMPISLTSGFVDAPLSCETSPLTDSLSDP